MRVIYYIAVVSGEWTALWLLHPTYKPIYRAIYRFGDGGEASVFLHRNSAGIEGYAQLDFKGFHSAGVDAV